MNTINPAATVALEQDAQKLLDATWAFHELAGPNYEKVEALMLKEEAEDLAGETVAEIMELLGVTDTLDLIKRTLEIHMAHHARYDAEKAYVKTRRLLLAVGAN